MSALLTRAEVARLTNAKCPREFGAVLAEAEARIGRELTVSEAFQAIAHIGREHHRDAAA